jgi:hypothetical protein
MNRHGTVTEPRWLPSWVVARTDPEGFFSRLGREVEAQIGELAMELAGDDPPGEGYLEELSRLNVARLRAEEIALRGRMLLPPEPGLEGRDPEP